MQAREKWNDFNWLVCCSVKNELLPYFTSQRETQTWSRHSSISSSPDLHSGVSELGDVVVLEEGTHDIEELDPS